MSVSREEVRRIATLARVRIAEAEADAIGRDVNDILDYVDTLASVPVDDVQLPEATQARAPERVPGDRQPDPLLEPPSRYAPEFRDEFFVVPSPPSLGTAGEPPSPA